MPIQCRLVDPFPGWDNLQPGDMWFYAADEWHAHDGSFEERFRPGGVDHGLLAPEYWRDNYANRPPLCVQIPGVPSDWTFYVDSKSSDGVSGWAVTGEPPNITVSPSIHAFGVYHGWLQNGVLSDDIDGRNT